MARRSSVEEATRWSLFRAESDYAQSMLIMSLLDLSESTEDLAEIIDKAGDFLISIGAYADGSDLYRAAAARFPATAVFHQGLSCCGGHVGSHDEALVAAEAALALEPDNQQLVNDLGWTLYLAGRLEDARATLERALAMDPSDRLAAENLRLCLSARASQVA